MRLARRFCVLLVILLGTGIGMATPSQGPTSYPTRGDLEPFRGAMLGFRDATIYHIGSPPQPPPPGYSPDSPGSLMGYPILDSVSVRRVSWFDSLSEIVLNPRSYLHEERLCIQTPSLAVRVRGQQDSVTVLTGSGCEFLLARTGSGVVIGGWLDDPGARQSLRILTEGEMASPATPPDQNHSVYTIDAPEPVYPEEAKRAKIEGQVVLHVLVLADGRVKNVKVIRSVPLLDDSAVEAVWKWTFEPARVAGKPVVSWIEVPINFHLPRGH